MTFGLRAQRLAVGILAFARRPELLAFLPAVTLAAFWLGGEAALMATALAVPVAYAVAGLAGAGPARDLVLPGVDPVTQLPLRDAAVRALDAALDAGGDGRGPACIVLAIDRADALARLHGHAAFGEILRRTGARIAGAVQRRDTVCRLDGACFAVALAPARGPDLEAVLQTAARLQDAVELDLDLDGTPVALGTALGVCLGGRAPAPGGAALLDAAVVAMEEAARQSPGAIRVHAAGMRHRLHDLADLRAALETALDEGQVQAFFQPQLSTDTGAITGVETLVRWRHPDHGLLRPADFLPDLLAAGLSERLGEVMLDGALRTLRRWDRAGHRIPTVTVNFSPEELRNPRLPERVQWELDRFGLAPERLVIDIREAVLAEPACEVVAGTLHRLAGLGCGIDLDSFGTGRASIEAVRRFPVRRLKIGRGFVADLDADGAQRRTVAAVLALAERLDLDTLAVGVETPGEHAMLAQLGCRHVQGFAIARAMPEDDAARWITTHAAQVQPALPIARRHR